MERRERKRTRGRRIVVLVIASLLYLLVFVAIPSRVGVVHAFSGSGSGTAGDPYVITTVTQLQEMKDNLTAYYILGNDIDASATSSWNDNGAGGYYGFAPIGNSTNRFAGTFDGNNHKIINLYINRPSTSYVGLFGYVNSGGVVKNVGLESVNITGYNYVGGLAGYNYGTVSNCYSTGSVSGNYYVGGLAGWNEGGVNNCYSAGYVSGGGINIGGLVGYNCGTVSNCYSTGSVSGTSDVGGDVGGLVGINIGGGTVSNCYSTGSVSGGGFYIGGLAGYNSGTVSNCYSTGSVSGENYVGGLAGWNEGGVNNCYSTGSVSGNYYVGGLVGVNMGGGGTVSNCFWDMQTSGRSTSAGGTGKTTDNMKNVRTFTDNTWSTGLTTPWDFVGNPYYDTANDNIWDINSSVNSGYPFLSWQVEAPNPPTSLLCEGQTNPTHITDNQPEFSAVGTDPNGDNENAYALQVDNDSNFSSPIYNKPKTAITTFASGTRCSDISYENTNLIRGIIYYWRIKFWDNNGNEGAWSTETATFKINQLPTAPSGITDLGMHVTDHTPEISWTKGTDADGDTVWTYIYMDSNPTPTTLENSTVGNSENIGENSITLVDGATYYYRLRSWDGYEWSSYSPTYQFRMNTPPTTPTTLTLNSPKVGQALTATGSGSTDAEGDSITYYYRFYNQTDGVERQAYSTTSTYTITAADAHDNIRVFAKAYDGYEYSGEKENSIIVANTLPTPPTSLSLNPPKKVGETITASGSGSTDIDGDLITYYYKFYNQNDGVVRQDWSTSSNYTLVSADAHDNIKVFCKSYDGYGYSGEIDNSFIVANTPPSVPTGINDLGMNIIDHTPDKTFTKGTDTDGDTVYTIAYLGTTPTPTEEDVRGTGSTLTLGENTSHSCYPLADGQTYYVRLRSWDGHDYSEYTSADVFRMNSLPTASLVAPDNNATGASITPVLDWAYSDNENDPQAKYWVLLDNDSDFSSPMENTGEVESDNTHHYVTVTLSYSTKYYWKVKVYDGYEWSGWYGVWNFTTGTEPNLPPNKPTNLLPSARQTTTNVAISCVVTDNDGNTINVHFYDNSDNSPIDNVWIASRGTAQVTWENLTRGQTYSFFARGQDNNGAWGDNSDVQTFMVNSAPICSITASEYSPNAGVGIQFHSNASDADNDSLTYYWSFGDGTTSSDADPTHTYGSSGDYTVTLYVSDGYENSATSNATINVQGGGGGGGGGGWLPAVKEGFERIVEPSKNVLFKPLFTIVGFSFQIWMLLAIIAVGAWHSDQKGLAWSCIMIFVFLLFFGSRIV
jgi:hypothetical protein